MKKLLFLILISINVVMLGQTKHKECEQGKASKPDTIPNIVVIHSEMSGQTNKEIERGYFKVLKIDTLNSFYLIFIAKNNIKSTIYSEQCLEIKGQKLEIDSMYYFELTCKDTLYNGTCLTPIPDVTYFEKYRGYELGKINIAKNLCGLVILGSIESSNPRREELYPSN